MPFDHINLTDLLVVTGLGSALILAILDQHNELAMSIASGLLGYLGAVTREA